MRVSLIIPAYNEEAYIGGCLDSVIAHAPDEFFEIIVVDNASTDNTAKIASAYPEVRVVHEPKKGLPSARERGRLEASGDFLAYIDADTRMHSDWLPLAKKVFDKNPEAVSISGPARYWDAGLWQRMVLEFFWWTSSPLMYRVVGYMIYGAHFIVKREALEKIGGFDTGISFYGEDTDLARRLSKVGKTVFRMDFYILSSARRFKKEGIIKSNFVYTMNFLWPVIFNRPFTFVHKDIRSEKPNV
ncbi:MAG: family 2 glycosyl transferase [Parcubacteria group bacterium Gr01-1014_56]|nr:MAG: family 2 glycosyl transferase [Parcubacteria group bacterium Gr01-1014_56]